MKVMPCTNHSEKAKELRQAFVPVCTANGNYKLEQCICEGVDAHKREECRGVQTQCWCIDKHGDQITSTVVHDRKYLDCRTGEYISYENGTKYIIIMSLTSLCHKVVLNLNTSLYINITNIILSHQPQWRSGYVIN